MSRPRPAADPPSDPADDRVKAVRRFNRFYTRRIGVLTHAMLGSEFSLVEVRILYEFAQYERPTAEDLATELGLDDVQLGAILRKFELLGLVAAAPSGPGGGDRSFALTDEGRAVLAPLDRAASEQVAALLAPVAAPDQVRLVEAMDTIESVLAGRPAPPAGPVVRAHRPGDLGWVVQRHGAVYAAERGWDQRFEALVARIVADFAANQDPQRARCWIAERRGERVGSILLAPKSKSTAKLRLLLVEPRFRGEGIGRRLVETCVRFARSAGYRKVVLWTERDLDAARRLYEAAGFRKTAERAEHRFGCDVVMQTWELVL